MRRLATAKHAHAEETDAEGSWAISYGDMLTLLLAFFILFFSIDPQKAKDSALASSLLATLAPLAAKDMSRFQPYSNDGVLANPVDLDMVTAIGAQLIPIGHKIYVEFPEVSFFGSGGTTVTQKGQEALNQFARLFTPYAGTHILNVQGFTDERPVTPRPGAPRDNLELSALRAVSAQRTLQAAGIPLDRMRIGGQGVKLYNNISTLKDAEASESARQAMARKVVLVIEPEVQP